MNIENPARNQTAALRALWKEAFGDEEAYLNAFFSTAFLPERCRCVMMDGQLAAALYWLDCRCRGEKLAYIYAVATAKVHRGRGLCRALMADTHAHLRTWGYQGTVLVPEGDALARMYGGMGYEFRGGIREFSCLPGAEPAAPRKIDTAEYAALRRQLLPEGGVVQEGENLALLETQAELYAGDGFLLAARREGDRLIGMELLGDTSAAPGILMALGLPAGTFRTPGGGRFAMYRPLGSAKAPDYFGLAFD